MRRYICSFYAPNFLFPPQELLYLATRQKEKGNGNVYLFDAIGENAGYNEIKEIIKKNDIQYVISLTGFESIEYELNFLDKLKKDLTYLKLIIFGHYPTIFYKEILTNTEMDFILLNEPDETFSTLSDTLYNNKSPEGIKGLAFRSGKEIYFNGPRERIKDLDTLPIPVHSLLNIKLYYEPLFPRPYTTIQTARGCPFNCNYCVRTFGREYYSRSPDNVFKEISYLANELKIKNFRIVDDTFTINKKNVLDLARKIIASNIRINWTCLSRLDTLDDEVLSYLEKAGCKRIFIGIESGSQKILDIYNKGYKLAGLIPKLKNLSKFKIETAGYFMVGIPEETPADLNRGIALAQKLDLDYVMISKLFYYPGTNFFDSNLDSIEFRLFPKYRYVNRRIITEKKYIEWEKYFYKRFYLRISYLKKWILKFFKSPVEVLSNLYLLLRYIYADNQCEERKDLF